MSVIAVTGASAGIGRAIARQFGGNGWSVGLMARGLDGLEAAQQEIERSGGRALVLPLDVADAGEVEAAAERIERELGPIEVWVNDAMVTVFAELVDISPQDFRRATEVTYLGTVWGTQAALKRMLPRDHGTIIQVGSALAYRSIPLQSVYCGAKSAIRGLTDSVRSELIHRHSRVHLTMVQLSAFNTPQFDWARNSTGRQAQPLAPIFQPEIAAKAVWWAAHHRRRELWVGTPALKAIVGNRMLPGFLDRLLAHRAYDRQLADAPLPPGRRDNLYAPFSGDHAAHGRFDRRARGRSVQAWTSTHLTTLTAALAVAVAAMATIALAVPDTGEADA